MILQATHMYFRQMVRNYTAQVTSMRRGAKENIEAVQLSKLRNAKFEVGSCMIYDCSCQLTLTVGQTFGTLLKLSALSLFPVQLSCAPHFPFHTKSFLSDCY